MSVAPVESYTIDDLDALRLPPGKHEIIDGSVHVAPPPTVDHEWVIQRIEQQLRPQLPTSLLLAHNVGVGRPDHYLVPDVVVVRAAALRRGGRLLTPDQVELVVEVVSPTSRTHDWVTKASAYPTLGVERYWVVDPAQSTLVEVVRGTAVAHGLGTVSVVLGGVEVRLDVALVLAD